MEVRRCRDWQQFAERTIPPAFEFVLLFQTGDAPIGADIDHDSLARRPCLRKTCPAMTRVGRRPECCDGSGEERSRAARISVGMAERMPCVAQTQKALADLLMVEPDRTIGYCGRHTAGQEGVLSAGRTGFWPIESHQAINGPGSSIIVRRCCFASCKAGKRLTHRTVIPNSLANGSRNVSN